MKLLNLFRKSKGKLRENPDTSIKIDFHSHILPGIDDGAKTLDDSIELIQELKTQGIEKIITTPHIIRDLYPNTPEIIRGKRDDLVARLKKEAIDLEVVASAEYYVDEYFLELLEKQEELLTFKDKSILIETNYVEKPNYLEKVIFEMRVDGYEVILAHPERYHFLIRNEKAIERLFDTGVKFQTNLISFTGQYSKEIKMTADFLLEQKMISYIGSDIHHIRHAKLISHFKRTDKYQKILELDIQNNAMF